MGADYAGMAKKAFQATWRISRILTVNLCRRGLILGRYTLACWQKQKVNRAMRRLGEQFFQALEQGETNPLVVSEVSAAVTRAKGVKEVKDRNYQAIAAIKARIRAAWGTEPAPPPAAEAQDNPETAAP
jgi:hypothetical protein